LAVFLFAFEVVLKSETKVFESALVCYAACSTFTSVLYFVLWAVEMPRNKKKHYFPLPTLSPEWIWKHRDFLGFTGPGAKFYVITEGSAFKLGRLNTKFPYSYVDIIQIKCKSKLNNQAWAYSVNFGSKTLELAPKFSSIN